MLYPITNQVLYLQTDNIVTMTVSAGPVYTILSVSAVSTVVTAAQFFDIIAVVNAQASK